MPRPVLAILLTLASVLASASALAETPWQQPTAEELSMKSYAADPDAPAVYLNLEETADDTVHMHFLYARVKILTAKGKEMFSEIDLPPDVASLYKVTDVAGRTILSDGTIVPFTGKPYDKLLLKANGVRITEKVFALPDVQVGSILEFRYKLRYDDLWNVPPSWRLQQRIPVLKAHYSFRPDGTVTHLVYIYDLPHNEKLIRTKSGYDLTISDVPALPHDSYLPPMGNLIYRVIFYYSSYTSAAAFWKDEGVAWSKGFDDFAHVSGKIRDVVRGIVSPGDTDRQKAEKIYAAVMKMENTDFTRVRSAMENKAEHLKAKYAQDIWAQQRGGGDQIAALFIAMARTAGLKAYGAIVVDRDRSLFSENYLNWSQMDDDIAIVIIDGKEVFLDPGQRYCAFGKLSWKHTWAGGIRQTDQGTVLFTTPGMAYTDNVVTRVALLSLDADGSIHGRLSEVLTGAGALTWRQAALTEDLPALEKEFQKYVQKSVPPEVTVQVTNISGLTDYDQPLTVALSASGTLGTQTGKYTFLPATFFEAAASTPFSETSRKYPVDMYYPYAVRDQFSITLPPNLSIDSLPLSGEQSLNHGADYVTKFVSVPGAYQYGRLFIVAKILYTTQEYPELRNYFQTVSANDQKQVALKASHTAAVISSVAK